MLRRLMEFDRLAKKPEQARRAIPPIFKIVALVVFAQTMFTRAVDPVIPMIAADLAIDVKTAALLSTAFALSLCADPAGARRHRRFLRQDPADERLRAGDGARGAGLRGRDQFLAAGRHADRGRARGRRRVSGGDGAARRSRADQPASGRDRAPARHRAHRQRARRLDRRRDRRPVRLARRVRDPRHVFARCVASWRSGRSATRPCHRSRRSTAPRSSPTSAAFLPIRAPRSASARCSSKRSSSTDCFPMSASCCSASARPAPRSPAS